MEVVLESVKVAVIFLFVANGCMAMMPESILVAVTTLLSWIGLWLMEAVVLMTGLIAIFVYGNIGVGLGSLILIFLMWLAGLTVRFIFYVRPVDVGEIELQLKQRGEFFRGLGFVLISMFRLDRISAGTCLILAASARMADILEDEVA